MKVSVPTVFIDKEIVMNNIKKIVEKAKKNNLVFRPHFKTHQSVEVGKWFKESGVDCITVSSVRMARCFAKAGWKDITIAFPTNILEIKEINKLAKKIKLNLLVTNLETTKFLQQNIETQTDIWIEIDVGYHRSGIRWDNFKEILVLAQEIEKSSKLSFAGILTHSGHSYNSKNISEIISIHEESLERLTSIKKQLLENGLKQVKISIGDTPTASVAENLEEVDELRPGNFVFYDLKMLKINACSEKDIAIRVACPVVSKNKEGLELVIYGGAIHFSKDVLLDEEGRYIYGYLTEEKNNEWGPIIKSSYISSLSQEHGIIITDKNHFDKINIGDIVLIVPVHSCLTMNVMGNFRLTTGEKYVALCK